MVLNLQSSRLDAIPDNGRIETNQIEYPDDNENSLPIGVDAMRTPSCDMMFKSYQITDMKTYTDELRLSMSGEISVIEAPFSANAEYMHLAEVPQCPGASVL